jgi:hypothetical protein
LEWDDLNVRVSLEDANELDQLQEHGIAPACLDSSAVAQDYYTEPEQPFGHDSEAAQNRLDGQAGQSDCKLQCPDYKTRHEADNRHAQQRENEP